MENRKNMNEFLCEVLTFIGGKDNISDYSNCITRLRITVKDTSQVDMEKLQNISNTYRLLMNDNQLQIMFGPGLVNKAKENFKEILEKTL